MKLKLSELKRLIKEAVEENLEEGLPEAGSHEDVLSMLRLLQKNPKLVKDAAVARAAQELAAALEKSGMPAAGKDPGIKDVMPDIPGARVVGVQGESANLRSMIRSVVMEQIKNLSKAKRNKK